MAESLNDLLVRCFQCGQSKPRNEFYADRGRSTGIQSRCKDCSRKRCGQISYPRLRTTEGYKQQLNKRGKRSRQRYPEKVNARQAAKRRGLKKDACERCGATGKLEMHHPDYSKPLEVVTLCVPCHRIADKERREHERD